MTLCVIHAVVKQTSDREQLEVKMGRSVDTVIVTGEEYDDLHYYVEKYKDLLSMFGDTKTYNEAEIEATITRVINSYCSCIGS